MDDIDLEYTPIIVPISRPTRDTPEVVTVHLTREDAEYTLDSLLTPETVGEKHQRNRVKAAIREALSPELSRG
jgi:RNase P protein component